MIDFKYRQSMYFLGCSLRENECLFRLFVSSYNTHRLKSAFKLINLKYFHNNMILTLLSLNLKNHTFIKIISFKMNICSFEHLDINLISMKLTILGSNCMTASE